MARKSTIERLPAEVRETIGRLRERGRTIDEILVKLQELDVDVSRSALGRHVQKLDAIGEQIRRSRAVSEALIERFGEGEESRAARFNVELMHSMIMDLLAGEDGEEVKLDPKSAMFLADALAKLSRAHKTEVDREVATRREVAKQAAGEVERIARREGLSAETVDTFRAAILGIAA